MLTNPNQGVGDNGIEVADSLGCSMKCEGSSMLMD